MPRKILITRDAELAGGAPTAGDGYQSILFVFVEFVELEGPRRRHDKGPGAGGRGVLVEEPGEAQLAHPSCSSTLSRSWPVKNASRSRGA